MNATSATADQRRPFDPRRVHVERTGSPRVLRWVCRRADLVDDLPSPAGSPLAALAAHGVIRRAVGRDGDVIVDFGDATAIADTDRVRRVHDAVVATLAIEPWERTVSVTPVTLRRRTKVQT